MLSPNLPKCYKLSSKPSKFCPGCGHSIVLKTLGQVIDGFDISKKSIIGVDVGCSLLAWDFFDIDTVQTHHGRTVPVVSGIKMANEKAIAIAYLGEGGAYAIGLQALIYAAKRNDPITVIVVNNTLYGMTGGQKSPTTLKGEVTTSTPEGCFTEDDPLKGPELLKQITGDKGYIARASMGNVFELKKRLQEAFMHQINKKGFSFVEVLSICPTNWGTNAKDSMSFLHDKMEKTFDLGILEELSKKK